MKATHLIIAAAAIGLLLSGAAIAAPYGYSSSTVRTGSATYFDIQNYTANSNITDPLDLANNTYNTYAKSFVQPMPTMINTLDGGAAVGNSYRDESYTGATYGDTWGCTSSCVGLPAQLSLAFHVEGTTASLYGGGSLGFDYIIQSVFGTYDWFFSFTEDGGPHAYARLTTYDSSGNLIGNVLLSPSPIVIVDTNANLVSISWDATGVAFAGAAFSDTMNIGASVYGGTTAQFVNAFDTFTVGITSSDRTFVSDGGRSTAPSPPTSVPEPSTLLLLGSGLAGVVGVAWRRKRK